MSIENVKMDLGNGRELIVETGKMALLANGSVTVRQGDTISEIIDKGGYF